MADQPHDERELQHAQLFHGTVARGEVFDSLDSITSLDEPDPEPVVVRPRPAVVSSAAASDAPLSPRRRLLVLVAIALAGLGSFLVIVPFDVSSGGATAQCGPPVYEVLVPSDPAFDVPENSLCATPALVRTIVGGVLLVAFVALAFAHQWTARAKLRHARRARRQRARAAKHAARDDQLTAPSAAR